MRLYVWIDGGPPCASMLAWYLCSAQRLVSRVLCVVGEGEVAVAAREMQAALGALGAERGPQPLETQVVLVAQRVVVVVVVEGLVPVQQALDSPSPPHSCSPRYCCL